MRGKGIVRNWVVWIGKVLFVKLVVGFVKM